MDEKLLYKLKSDLERDEGFRSKPYRCSQGKLTIGIGRNLEDVGITRKEADMLLTNDIMAAEKDVKALFPNYEALGDARKLVLLNMMFNLGKSRLADFRKFRAAVQGQDFNTAALEMLDSLWARQVKGRAIELAEMMEKAGSYADCSRID